MVTCDSVVGALQFIDLCILLGCDYCDSIRGIGPKRAVELMRSHRSIEKILSAIDKSKYTIPDDFPYKQARELFKNPEVDESATISWSMPIDEEGLVQYLCAEKGFAEDRIRNGVKKLRAARGKSTQGRLDGFFSVVKRDGATSGAGSNKKPKVEERKKGAVAAGKKRGGGGFRRGK